MDELEDILGNDLRLLGGISWAFTFIIGFIGNIFIINVIRKLINYQKNIPNSLTYLQSIVDLINVFITYIQPLIVYINGRYLDRGVLCRIQTISLVFSNTLSIMVLLGIICERYYAVAKPYSYREHMVYNKNNIHVFLAICLLSATGISLPIVLGTGHSELYYPGTFCMFTLNMSNSHDRWNLIFYTLLIFTAIAITLAVSLGSCYTMYKMKTFREQHSTSQQGNRRHSDEFLFVRLCVVTLILFSVIWIPLLVTLCMALCGMKVPLWYILLSFRLAALQSVVNPLLYPILRKRYRSALTWHIVTTLHCFTCGKVSEPEYSLSDILSDSPTTRNDDEQRYKSHANDENNEGDMNIMLDIAQRNIHDYVDASVENSHDITMDNISSEHDIITHGGEKEININRDGAKEINLHRDGVKEVSLEEQLAEDEGIRSEINHRQSISEKSQTDG